MTEQQHRELVVDFDKIAKRLHEVVPKEFSRDVTEIFYQIRYSCHLLSDIRRMIDMQENPMKVFAEYTPKKTGSANETGLKLSENSGDKI